MEFGSQRTFSLTAPLLLQSLNALVVGAQHDAAVPPRAKKRGSVAKFDISLRLGILQGITQTAT